MLYDAIAIIPARYASTRLPAKPLLKETGKFLIQHAYETALRSKYFDRVIVATDDERIYKAVKSFGGEAVMTSVHHKSGTDRIAEAVKNLDAKIIINVQGDNPEIPKNYFKKLIEVTSEKDVDIGTLVCEWTSDIDPRDPNKVKAVIDKNNNALYFSRSLIPYDKFPLNKGGQRGLYYFHIGLYGFKKKSLIEFTKLKPSKLELIENLEQLRALENGMKIKVGVVNKPAFGIDTPEDYKKFVKSVKK